MVQIGAFQVARVGKKRPDNAGDLVVSFLVQLRFISISKLSAKIDSWGRRALLSSCGGQV